MAGEIDPIIHTSLPKERDGHYGEYELGQILRSFTGQGLEFWFDLNFLPGVPDIDMLLYSKKVGVFVCEVKSHTMAQIRSYTLRDMTRADGKSVSHPVAQVRRNSQQLQSFHERMLKSEGKTETVPFFQTTVIWPRITRAQWNDRFKSPSLRDQAKSFIFQDDLTSARTFIEKLAEFGNNPLLGVVPPMAARGKLPGMPSLTTYIKQESRQQTTSKRYFDGEPADIPRTEREVNKYPFGETHKVMMTGAAGTGKTTFLQQVGMQHALAGARVLYVCYNQALATEVKRQFQVMRLDEDMTGHIDVYDQYGLYEHLAPEVAELGYSATANDVILCLKRLPKDEVPTYDTILIDEGQDIDGNAILLAKFLSTSKTSWFTSVSKGQELFGFDKEREFPCRELKDVMADAKKPTRNRLFRGAQLPFLAAYAYQAFTPSMDKVYKFIEDKVLTQRFQPGEDELEKALPSQAKALTLHYLPTEQADFEMAVRGAVFEALQEVKEAGENANLMIVVFGERSPTYPLVKRALGEVKQRVHDLTRELNRRELAPAGAVRIVKAMGSRGLTATHVLVFDFDYIQTWCEQKPGRPPATNLGYVVLTRASQATRVFVGTENINEHVRFLDRVVSELRRVQVGPWRHGPNS